MTVVDDLKKDLPGNDLSQAAMRFITLLRTIGAEIALRRNAKGQIRAISWSYPHLGEGIGGNIMRRRVG